MFDKRKCKRCKYHMRFTGGGHKGKHDDVGCICCGYALNTHQTCLREEKGKMKDLRGDDPKHCLLYEAGNPKGAQVLH